MDSDQEKMTAYYKYPWLVITYYQGTQSCWIDNFLRLFDQLNIRINYTLSIIKPGNRLIESLEFCQVE